jgi:hypothetical protein
MLSGPPSRFFLLGGPSFRSAFHMSELFFAQRFVLGFSLTKVSARRGSGSLFGLRWLTCLARTAAMEEATQQT